MNRTQPHINSFAGILLAFSALVLGACNAGPGGGTGVDGVTTGTLVDPEGRPAAGVWVRVYPAMTPPALGKGVEGASWKLAFDGIGDRAGAIDSVLTQGNGSFVLKSLRSAYYNLSAISSRHDSIYAYSRSGVLIKAGNSLGIDTMRVAGQVRIRITTEGNLVEQAMCYVPGTPYYAISDSEGNCILTGLPPGSFDIIIQLPGYLPGVVEHFQVISGVKKEAGILELKNETSPPPPTRNFRLTASTLALWSFNELDAWGNFHDESPRGHHLPAPQGHILEPSPFGKAVRLGGIRTVPQDHTRLTLATEQALTYEARVKLDAYPSANQHNSFATLLGSYPGLKMLVRSDGRLQVAVQRGDGTMWNWYAPLTAPRVVPLGEWVNLAVSADRKLGSVSAYVNGVAQQLYTSGIPADSMLRGDSAFAFTVGNDGVDNQPFHGLIDEIRISRGFVHPAGPAPLVTADPLAEADPTLDAPLAVLATDSIRHFALTPTTLAHWTFNRIAQGERFVDISGSGHHLPARSSMVTASPHGQAASPAGQRLAPLRSAPLTLAENPLLTYEARVWLDAYPSASQHNGFGTPVGAYAGLKMLVRHDGRLQVAGQLGDGSNWNWYAPISDSGAVPLGRWVNLAVSADRDNGKLYAFIDGVPLRLVTTRVPAGDRLRGLDFFPFTIGNDSQDEQPFHGRIDEVRVSRGLVHGTAPDPEVVPNLSL